MRKPPGLHSVNYIIFSMNSVTLYWQGMLPLLSPHKEQQL
jgi:hypothetical protein